MTVSALYVGGSLLAGGLAAAYLRRRSIKPKQIEPQQQKSLRLRGAGAADAKVSGVSSEASFPWGNEPFAIALMPACMVIGAVGVATAVALTKPSGPMNGSLELARGPVLVTLTWIWGFYNCIGAQLGVKMGDKGDAKAAFVAERSLMNTLEQSVPFLSLLWMQAAFVDAAIATSVGWFYVALRMLYPLAYTYYGGFSMLCEFITQPNYACINFLAYNLLAFGLGHGSLLALTGSNFVVVTGVTFASLLMNFMILWNYPVGSYAASRNLHYNPAK